MCGISGFFDPGTTRPRPDMLAIGRAMSDALARRGPDDSGHWQDPDIALLLGHRRLSVIDLTDAGRQPMVSANGRYVIVFNGEIYNYQELARELQAKGEIFSGRSDTEVMLAAFSRWGVNQALQKIGGMFAFALWDRERRELHLVRDRLGKKPLYVGWAGGELVFGSELKALRAHPGFAAQLDRQSLTLYMRYACVPAPYSIYRRVWQLLPGCRLTLDLARLDAGADLAALMQPFWNPARVAEESKAAPAGGGDHDMQAGFEKLLTACVRQRMIADVPLGAFLSGGIDSSLVVALMQKLSPRPVKTFTIGFAEPGFDESGHAREIAACLGTDHQQQIVTAQDALAVIPDLPDIYDEPFADISQIPTYLVSRFARRQVTVALTGDGGDEMFGGYQRHYIVPAFWARAGWFPQPLRALAAAGIKSMPTSRWDQLAPRHPQFGERIHKLAEILPEPDAPAIYRRLVSQFDDPAALVAGGAEPVVPLVDPERQPHGLAFAEQMMFGDALSYLPNDVLVKVDRASMACGLETRAPLLDHRIFSYAWSLPPEAKIRQGRGKWLLRAVLARHVPPALFERPKQGFAVPIGTWLNGPLNGWAQDLLSPERLARDGFLNPEPVQRLWREHRQGQGRNAHKLWTILMFLAWRDRWL